MRSVRVRHACGGPGGLPLGSATHFHSVAIATQPMHRLQIRPIVHNYGASPTTPPSYIRVRAIVWACGRGQPHRQTHTETHRRAWPQYISRGLRLTRNVKTIKREDPVGVLQSVKAVAGKNDLIVVVIMEGVRSDETVTSSISPHSGPFSSVLRLQYFYKRALVTPAVTVYSSNLPRLFFVRPNSAFLAIFSAESSQK